MSAADRPSLRAGLPWILGLGLLLILGSTSIDLLFARCLYSPEDGEWRFGGGWFAIRLYQFGPWLGAALAIGSLLTLLLQAWIPACRAQRRLAMILCLTYLIGPGLIVNSTLKPVWGRSRPRNLSEFGGAYGEFRPVFSLDQNGHGTSFPSGHASAGFYLATPNFPLRRRRPRLARGFLAAGLLFGSLMGVARILQGGHFLSDVVAAGLITLATGALVTRLFERRSAHKA